MKLKERDFLALTPAEFDALMMRFHIEQQRRDYRAGVIATIVASSIPTKKKKKYKPSDFFPSLKRKHE